MSLSAARLTSRCSQAQKWVGSARQQATTTISTWRGVSTTTTTAGSSSMSSNQDAAVMKMHAHNSSAGMHTNRSSNSSSNDVAEFSMALLEARFQASFFDVMDDSTDVERGSMIYSLSHATLPLDESMLSSTMQTQLQHADSTDSKDSAVACPSLQQLHPLPTTLQQALKPSTEARVITQVDAPFSITYVNPAWEDLCGYTKEESIGQKVSTLLQGPDTDVASITALLAQLLRGETAEIMIVNYTKTGRRFWNRLCVAPLWDDDKDDGADDDDDDDDKVRGAVTHFLGVLREVTEEEVQHHQQRNPQQGLSVA